MITLITAVPGSGKTLYTLKTLAEIAKREDRQVYYYGIKLTDYGKEHLGWVELEDPHKWYELPAMAIVVIDEFQKVFPKRPNGAQVPKYISEFETHRHLGLDVYLITQGTKLFDTHLKDLIGKHIHLLRIFGAHAAQVLKWDGCQQSPNSRAVKADCLDKSKFIYPKEVFKWYVSAEAHTHKIQIPKKIWAFLFFLVLAVVSIYFSIKLVGTLGKKDADSLGTKVSASQPATAQSTPAQPKRALTVAEYAAARVPRMTGAPESEPRFDDLATPKTFPRIVACISSAKRCACYSQQGTQVDLPDFMCRERVARSQFDPYVDERQLHENTQLVNQQLPQPPQRSQTSPQPTVVGIGNDRFFEPINGSRAVK